MKTKSILLLVLIAMIQEQALVASKHFLIETEDKNLADDDVVAFKRFDKDGDGLVTLSELMSLIKKVGGSMPEQEARALLEEADQDGNQGVDYQEFTRLWSMIQAPIEGSGSGLTGPTGRGIPDGGKTCFSGTSTVQTRRGVLSMEQLVLGDSVLTISRDKGLIYTEFLGWLDRSANANGLFLKISTSSSSIALTGNHLIFRTSVADGSLESVFADQIETGDKLVSWKGSKLTEETVVAVEPAVEKGTWAPFTMEGTLLVDGLLASCYASFPHALSELAYAPVKMFPRMLLDDQESVKIDGCREVVKLAKNLGTAMGLRQRNRGEKEVPRNVRLSGNATVSALAGFSKQIEL